MRESLRKFQQSITQLGWSNALLYAVSRGMRHISGARVNLYKYYFVAQPILVDSKPLPATATAEVKLVAHDVPVVADFPRPNTIIQQRFTNGAQCWVATVKGKFAGYLWLARGHYIEDEVRGRFVLAEPTRMVWDYDVYVVPEFRLGRTFARLWQTVNQQLAPEGVQWSLSRISAFNPDSLASHQRFGLTRLASGIFLCCGNLQLSFITRAPYFHASRSAANPPEIIFYPPAK